MLASRWPCGVASASSVGDTGFAPCCHRASHAADFFFFSFVIRRGCVALPLCAFGSVNAASALVLLSEFPSVSEGLSLIRHPGTRLVGDGRPATELGVACCRIPLTSTVVVWWLLWQYRVSDGTGWLGISVP